VRAALAAAWDAVATRIANPLVGIELAASFRRKRFVAAFSLTLLLVVAILVIVMVATVDRQTLFPSRVGQAIFTAFLFTIAFVLALLFPAFASASIVEERVNRSLDLLVVTRLAPWEIFLGKWAAAFVYGVTFLAGTLPVIALSFLLGGVEPQALAGVAAISVALAAAFAAIGAFASAATATLVRAVLASYFLCWLFGVGMFLASIPVQMRHVWTSTGVFSPGDLDEIEEIFTHAGDLVYAGTAVVFAGVIGFFAVVGANRLAPPSHDRSSAVRALIASLYASLVVLTAWMVRRMVGAFGFSSDIGEVYLVLLSVAASLLFFPTLVFSTETRHLSRRVRADLAARARLSPRRLLAPGPGRGALYSIALSAAILLGLGAEAGRGVGYDLLAAVGLENVPGRAAAFVSRLWSGELFERAGRAPSAPAETAPATSAAPTPTAAPSSAAGPTPTGAVRSVVVASPAPPPPSPPPPPGWGLSLGAPGRRTHLDRGDLSIPDLARVYFTFLAFLAGLGRLLAARARGVVWPRVLVVGLGVILAVGPMIGFAADQAAYRRLRDQQRPVEAGLGRSVTSGYFLSPIMAAISTVERKSRADWLEAFYVFPAAHRLTPLEEEHLMRGGTLDHEVYSLSKPGRAERHAVPLHTATTWFYGALALALLALGALVQRAKERREGASP
jgi:ABC-type transport system involved in multi-copper enzyme maturation permease subunit